jgi:ABC-type branched-subunit amino acid transport system substrate-binding protein
MEAALQVDARPTSVGGGGRDVTPAPGRATVGAIVPDSGRYAVQGAQLRAGVEAWARRAGVRLVALDDRSRPEVAAELHAELVARGCRFVLGPYGSDSTRSVAVAAAGAPVWNHGAAADDVQRLPGVVSVPSPSSRYLVALGRALAGLRPGASVTLVAAAGRFARFAADGLERAAPSLGLTIAARLPLGEPPGTVPGTVTTDAVLACGPLQAELALFRRLGRTPAIVGGVSPGLAAFPDLLGGDPDGLLAPVQWHPDLGAAPPLGPGTAVVAADAGRGLDYVAAQGYAAALVADRCHELDPADPLRAARALRTATFFGGFELDASGVQVGHRLSVVRWRGGRQELLLPEAA